MAKNFDEARAARAAQDREFVERLLAKKLIYAVGQLFYGRAIDNFLCWGGQHEVLAGIRECVVRHQRRDVA